MAVEEADPAAGEENQEVEGDDSCSMVHPVEDPMFRFNGYSILKSSLRIFGFDFTVLTKEESSWYQQHQIANQVSKDSLDVCSERRSLLHMGYWCCK